MSNHYAHEMAAAIRAVHAAARACRAVQQRLISPETIEKKDKSPVTVADFASQAVVCQALGESLPADRIVGEEDAHDLRGQAHRDKLGVVVEHVADALGEACSSEEVLGWIDRGGAQASGDRYWTLDPIDGTKGFLRKEQYAIALALIENGQVVLGVLGCPNLPPHGVDVTDQASVLLTAVRGEGAQWRRLEGDAEVQGEPVHVSKQADPRQARFCESVESGHSDQSWSQKIAQRLGIAADPVRMDSQCKYAAVARGDAEIYLRLPTKPGYEEKIWDHAACCIIREEAGGKVTDITGKPLDFGRGRTLAANRGIVATNPALHAMVVEAIAVAGE